MSKITAITMTLRDTNLDSNGEGRVTNVAVDADLQLACEGTMYPAEVQLIGEIMRRIGKWNRGDQAGALR